MRNYLEGSQLACGVAPPRFRLPDATHVGRVRLQVSDLRRSVAYYEQVLGLQVYTGTAHSATLGPHGEHRPLVTLETRSGVTRARRGSLGLYHFAILLPDRASLGRFAAHVSSLRAPVGMADHLVSEALYLSDPDGLGIEVYADRPRNLWRQNGHELMMTTEPLDVADLIAAGGQRPWDGMRAGTTIGHVHLHVGSLENAETFYHAAVGFDKMVWSYPGALFLAAGGYHHHLGTNTWLRGAPANANEARLIDWELVVPSDNDVVAAMESVRAAGYAVERDDAAWLAADPWATQVRIISSAAMR